MQLDEPRKRLLELIGDRQTDLKTVSEAIGKNHAYLQQFLKRGTPRDLPEDARESLGRHFNVDPDEFRSGAQPFRERAKGTRDGEPGEVLEVDVRGGLGGGGLTGVNIDTADGDANSFSADPIVGAWRFPDEYLGRELRVLAGHAKIIEVEGDSMAPTINSGDRVMVDTGRQRPTPPGIFAIWDGLGVVVKRIEFIEGSDPPTIEVISDNEKHRRYQRTLDEARIIGRVVWYARKL